MGIATQKKVLDALKKHRPALARVVLIDGEKQDVSLKGGRQRWTPAARAIDALPWVSVMLLDDRERLIAQVDQQQQPAGDVEELTAAPTSGTAQRELHLLRILLQAQEVALVRQAELVKPALDAMRQVVKDVFEQVGIARKEATKQAAHVSELADQLADLARNAEDAGQGNLASQLAEMAQAMPAIMQAVGAAQKMLGSGAAAKASAVPSGGPARPPTPAAG